MGCHFCRVELLEPTFRELIVVYRMKSDLKSAENLKSVPRVVLKSFTDIPIADFEVRYFPRPARSVLPPLSGCVARQKAQNSPFGPFWQVISQRAGHVSGRGFGYPHYKVCALSNEPKSGAARRLIPETHFSTEKVW